MPEDSSMEECSETELDLTNEHLPSLANVIIEPTLTDIDLTCNRLNEIDPRIVALVGLRKLSLRQNLIENADVVDDFQSKNCLEDLELRDNQFQTLPVLTGFPSLKRLEISYNEIRSMSDISRLGSTSLMELYLASNKITKIEGLELLSTLEILELGSNRIRTIESIGHLTRLTQLWLGRNRITEIQNLASLTMLRQLSLQSNRLETMQGLEACVGLEELYISHNGISVMEGLLGLTNLRVLDLSNNRIAKIEDVDNLKLLEDLWMNDNQIDSYQLLYEAMEGPRQTLTTVYLEGNGVAKDPMYQRKMLEILPNLTQLDANPVRRQ
ncbi:hypothetical protein BSKO_03256 [Bryopsis sp. KO-2023]|nr:hypothetical protein BSKO_03256 [Bryopsis sp. KO-2023]